MHYLVIILKIDMASFTTPCQSVEAKEDGDMSHITAVLFFQSSRLQKVYIRSCKVTCLPYWMSTKEGDRPQRQIY